jgi:acyl-homoserine lactone acylase PvdQ
MARGRIGAVLCGAALVALAFTTEALSAPQPTPYGTHDAGGFRAILPPGANGFVNGPQLLAFELGGTRPPHNDDQLLPYANLLHAAPGLAASQIGDYYHDATFGVKPGDVQRTYSPRGDVTVERDGLGVPHVYGATRGGAMFGLGYVAAEDRLFFIDALRHAGRAELSSFAGGANVGMDESVWADTPYTEADLARQFNTKPPGISQKTFRQGRRDVLNFIAGINQYIAEARTDPSKMPGEYAAIGQPLGPTDWKPEDLVSEAALIGGIFGVGGGGELSSALFLQRAQERFGTREGRRVWRDFRSPDDPEAPTTVHHRRFPYRVPPRHPQGVAIPDPGTFKPSQVVPQLNQGPGAGRGSGLLSPLHRLLSDGMFTGASNALLVSDRESEGKGPVAVMGPQVAYFAPQILMEEDVHAPGIDARGVAFPGVNLAVQIGHGRDYAWSATSAGQDIVDTFAVPLCKPGGGKATLSSDHYRFRGRCLPIEVLSKTISWVPNAGDQTPPGSETLRSERTKMGIVAGRGKVHGKPVLYTKLRSTYFHEGDSLLGFSELNSPRFIHGPKSFRRAAANINFTFNWFYVDRKHIAYFNSGLEPVRAPGSDPNFPTMSRNEWRNYRPGPLTSDHAPPGQHPQATDQNFFTSWNNKQAHGVRGDSLGDYGPTYRSVTLDERVRELIRGPRKASLAELIGAMEGAASVDLHGHTVLPFALAVIRSKPLSSIGSARLRAAVKQLGAWARSGAHRIDSNSDGHYEHSNAIRLLDAWFEPMMRAEFEPTLGKQLFEMAVSEDIPNEHLGSAYNGGIYEAANKDLRTIVGRPVRGRYSRVYCGRGRLARCRAGLLASLESVLGTNPYGENAGCGVGDEQMCFDAISFRTVGGISQPDIEWQNRPTFQQAIQVGRGG